MDGGGAGNQRRLWCGARTPGEWHRQGSQSRPPRLRRETKRDRRRESGQCGALRRRRQGRRLRRGAALEHLRNDPPCSRSSSWMICAPVIPMKRSSGCKIGAGGDTGMVARGAALKARRGSDAGRGGQAAEWPAPRAPTRGEKPARRRFAARSNVIVAVRTQDGIWMGQASGEKEGGEVQGGTQQVVTRRRENA